MENLDFLCDDSENRRIDVFVAENTELTRSFVAKLIGDGLITVDGKTASKNTKLKRGNCVSVTIPDPVSDKAEPENIPLDIVYEDEWLLVVNKPKGMVVHPAAGNESGTLVNALLFHCGDSLSGIGGVLRPGIVHRIDKDTSGLLIVAKNDEAHHFLAQQIKEHSFTREYEAVVYGNVKNDKGTINAPIGRHPVKRKEMAVVGVGGRDATTHFKVLSRSNGFSYVRLKLETGRTHQIRVHMSYIGYPLAGDEVYGPRKCIKELGGQCLHARKIGFIHPKTKEYMEFTSELPNYFKTFLEENDLL
ncbi:MAG: RluA family pseudouridine synthase [Ruminococcaceae bacterium]|nr:RluA family pseudouridine synthase [Oscillospiraceae bacterium]